MSTADDNKGAARPLHFETLSVHAGYKPDPTTKSCAG